VGVAHDRGNKGRKNIRMSYSKWSQSMMPIERTKKGQHGTTLQVVRRGAFRCSFIMRYLYVCVSILLSAVVLSCSLAQGQISPQRVAEITAMLPDGNIALAPPCADRRQWGPLRGQLSAYIAKADSLIGSQFPAWSDEDYLDYYKTGKRERGTAMMSARSSWLVPLVAAECATWNGKYVKTLSMVLDELAAQKSWALPAHDVDQGYISGKRYFVELVSADLANNLATTLYLLGDKLPANTRKQVMDALETRVFKPMRASYVSGKGQTWLKVESNWNAVCLAGVTGAALAVLPEKSDRAFFVAAAEHYQQYYLKSFPADGFEVEGIGYWNYGFSNYAVLREELWRATSGRLDLFRDPKVQAVARFGVDFQMLPGVLAYFADAHFGEEPSPALTAYVRRIFHIKAVPVPSRRSQLSFPFFLAQTFPSASELPAANGSTEDPLRKFYPVAGVLVSRPADKSGLAVTVKAMGNGPHSHNDIGSYAIGLSHGQPTGEAGGPAYYTAQTFSRDRFLSKLLNSYGHPVPMIDGQLQKEALLVNAPVLSKEFTPERDSISIDMTNAYDLPKLKRLIRTVVHNRRGQGSIMISDKYAVRSPVDVNEALITVGQWKKLDESTLRFTEDGASVDVKILCPEPFVLRPEKIDEYGRPFVRIGVVTKLMDGETIRFRIAPAD
jgi:hypothetical protein